MDNLSPLYHQHETTVVLIQRRQVNEMKNLFSLAALPCFAATLFAQPYQAEITQKDWVMTPTVAIAYQMHVVAPFLDKAIRDPTYPKGITGRITTLFNQIQAGKIEYRAEPFYYPQSKFVLAHVDWDSKQEKMVLMVFVPAIRNLRAEPAFSSDVNFELMMAITFAHEYVHVERDPLHPIRFRSGKNTPEIRRLSAQDEAEAWGVTILEMIRPALKQNRWLPENLRQDSEQLKLAKDNYDDPGWIQAFAHYAGQ